MPVGATHPMHTSKGHIVRIFCEGNITNMKKYHSNFYWLMRNEANPVSHQGGGRIVRGCDTFYWNGAVVAYSANFGEFSYSTDFGAETPPSSMVEIQHKDKATLDSLVDRFVQECSKNTNVKFRRKTVIGELERAERKRQNL